MTTPTRRETLLPDVTDWIESLPMWMNWRAVTPLQAIRVEHYIEDNEYVVRAELPGIDPDNDVDISVERGVLTIRAERTEEKTEKSRTEFRYGTFARSLRLPEGANEDKVSADYKDGILTVRIPFEKPKEPKKIAVSRGE